jgi:hypothetical protein
LRQSNVELAKKLCGAAINAGHSPFAPHLFFTQFTDDDNLGIELGQAWLRMADELWVYAENLDACSAGMKVEIEFAEKLNLPPKLVFMPDAFRSLA